MEITPMQRKVVTWRVDNQVLTMHASEMVINLGEKPVRYRRTLTGKEVRIVAGTIVSGIPIPRVVSPVRLSMEFPLVFYEQAKLFERIYANDLTVTLTLDNNNYPILSTLTNRPNVLIRAQDNKIFCAPVRHVIFSKVYRNGVEVSPIEYTTDNANGLVIFNTAQATNAVITADYLWQIKGKIDRLDIRPIPILYQNQQVFRMGLDFVEIDE